MTVEKIMEVLAKYRTELEKRNVPAVEFPHYKKPRSSKDRLSHLQSMLDEMEDFLREGRLEKVFRWLGFMQGCFWSEGIYTLNELRDHNR